MRSKVVMRLRQTRNDEAPLRSAEMAQWQTARRQEALATRTALAEDTMARRSRRAAAASSIQSKLDELAKQREQLRLESDKERSAHLVDLIITVNQMTADFQAAGDERKRASNEMSAEVAAFLNERGMKRGEWKFRRAADCLAFRSKLAKAAMQARYEDFH